MAWKDFMSADVSEGADSVNVVAPNFYVADSSSDIANLPNLDKTAWGSVCIQINPYAVYILNSGGNWIAQ